MRYANYFLTIFVMHGCLLAMEQPVTIDSKEPGIFLESIISEYTNPVTVSLLPLRLDDYSGDCWVNEEYAHNARVLAVAWEQKVAIKVPQIETKIKFTPDGQDRFATIREIAALRVEDVLTKAKADVWVRKYLKFHKSRDKRGHFFVNNEVIEPFTFDHNQLSHSCVTLKLTHKTRLNPRDVVVTSKTTSLGIKYEPYRNEGFLP
jgi:hypothetical protein